MTSVYLYLSTAKLEQLNAQTPDFLTGVATKLEFKLPFLGGSISGTSAQNHIAGLHRLEKRLLKEFDIPPHDNIPAGLTPVFVTFRGRAVRAIQNSEYWMALDHPRIPLLLAGSAAFTLGERPSTSHALFTPSADPVGAFVKAFKAQHSSEKDQTTARAISYIWRSLISESARSHAKLPLLEGLAGYATTARASRDFFEVWRPDVEQIVVGTPLYVRQVEEREQGLGAEATSTERRKDFLIRVATIQDFERGFPKKKALPALAYRLYCLGYCVDDGRSYGSGFYLASYRQSGRWDRVYVLYRPSRKSIAEHVRSTVVQGGWGPCEMELIDDAVASNNECDSQLLSDGVDVAVIVCSG